MYFINNIFLFPFSGGCTGATYLYFWEPPQKLPAGCAPRRITQHVHQTFVLFPNIDNSLGGLSFGTDGDGNYGYYGADGSLIPFSSFKNLKALTAEKPSSDTYSINGYTVECKATSLYSSSYPARYAFSYGRNSWSSSRDTTNQYATIEFGQEVSVKLARVIDDNESGSLSGWKLQYSDDGTTFYDIEENIIFSGINCKIFSCETGSHKYYRFFQSTWGTGHYELFGNY